MAHIHVGPGQIDLVNAIFLVHRDTRSVLLVHHNKLGGWFAPGGHVELHEDADQALFREVFEETGLSDKQYQVKQDYLSRYGRRSLHWVDVEPEENHDVTELLVPWRMEVHNFPPLPSHRHMALVYVGESFTRDVRLEEGAHKEIRWFTADELDNQPGEMLETIRLYGLDAIRLVCGD
jgi:8-oxo-dGTP pyrophosphatase MutT (NUDIX family)